MNIQGLLNSIEFIVETQELRKLGLTDDEIRGYFCFNWDLDIDLITLILKRGTDAKH